MRRTVLLLAVVALALLLAGGLALAAPKGGEGKTIKCVPGSASCQGTAGNDTIIGTDSADVIIPYAGDDTVLAGDGNDEVRHSFGNDYIEGGPGADTLRGGFDNDTIYGNARQNPQTNPETFGVDVPDGRRDLIDCAYIASRKDKGQKDLGFGGDSNDVVVDCFNRDDQ